MYFLLPAPITSSQDMLKKVFAAWLSNLEDTKNLPPVSWEGNDLCCCTLWDFWALIMTLIENHCYTMRRRIPRVLCFVWKMRLETQILWALLWPWTGGSEARHDGFCVLLETSEARNLEMFIVTKLQRWNHLGCWFLALRRLEPLLGWCFRWECLDLVTWCFTTCARRFADPSGQRVPWIASLPPSRWINLRWYCGRWLLSYVTVSLFHCSFHVLDNHLYLYGTHIIYR